MSVFIIAEAGVNHNGDRDLAFQLVDVAIAAGADAVKFQTFKADQVVTKKANQAVYQQRNSGIEESQLDMLKRLELSSEIHYDLAEYCKKAGIEFLSTAFDFDSLKFLVKSLKLTKLKIPSGEITNGPFLLEHAYTNCDLILSTGMATLGEIEEALGVIAFGLIGCVKPSRQAFQAAYCSQEGQEALQRRVTLLHCTSEYPAPVREINLHAMLTLRNSFGLEVGYSDHSDGIVIPTAATALGAVLIEKHFTLDKELPGPDHRASLDKHQLKAMVSAVRTVEQAMGSGVKRPMPNEMNNRDIARKTVVAACNIAKGEKYTKNNLDIKRAGTGRSPMCYWDMLGRVSCCDYVIGDVVR